MVFGVESSNKTIGITVNLERRLSQNPINALGPETVNVTDSMRGNWVYNIASKQKLEVGQNLFISAKWNQTTSNANISSQQSTDGDNFLSPTVYKTTFSNVSCDGTIYSNFSLNVVIGDDTIKFKRFRISAYLEVDDVYVTTEWTYYEVLAAANPTIPNANVPITASIIDVGEKKGVELTYSNIFYDNVGIKNYQIARKSANDNIKISSTNFVANIIGESSTTTFIDDTLAEDDTSKYYYGVRAIDHANQNSPVKALDTKVSTDIIPPDVYTVVIRKGDQSLENNPNITPTGTIEIVITTDSDCASVTAQLINQAGSIIPYEFELSKIGSSNAWSVIIDATKPRGTGNPIQAGTYNLKLELTDDVGNVQPKQYDAVFTVVVENPGEEKDNILLYVGIGIGVGALALASIIIVKKKKYQSARTDSDVVMKDGPSKAKKGKIYKGASSIGKASGNEAELMQRRRTATPEVEKKSSSKPVPSAAAKMAKPTAFSTPATAKNFNTIPTSESDIDELLNDNKPTAMKMKQAESGVELTRKMEFLTSKMTSLDQNMALMNIILEQSSTLTTPSKQCNKCGRDIPVSWQNCAFCFIDQNQTVISQKMKSVNPLGTPMMCPVCRKILHPSWNKCPYCLNK
jgi:hypothetical protein